MWMCRIKEARPRRNRWYIEGTFRSDKSQEDMPFSISVRFGWLALEGVSGSLFKEVLQHFSAVLGEPKEPPTCAGSSECQDDAVHLTTSWEIGEISSKDPSLFAELLGVSKEEFIITDDSKRG